MATNTPAGGSSFEQRVRFICALAKSLHEHGTSAPRLEAAIDAVSARLDLSCNIWSNPTGILVSFADGKGRRDALADATQVIRLEPGDVHLRRLARADEIAEQVSAGQLDLDEGYRQLTALSQAPSMITQWLVALAFGPAAGCVAALIDGSWADVGVATLLGTAIGLLGLLAAMSPRFGAGYEALAAFVAAFGVLAIDAMLVPLNVNSVLIASLIVLLPGLMLTTAVVELATQNLVSGMARFAGAGAVLLKLVIGTAAGLELARIVGLVDAGGVAGAAIPAWAEWAALAFGSAVFAVLFRADWSDLPLVMASAWLGYLTTRFAGIGLGAEFGVFAAGLVVGVASNVYARLRNRPGALVRVPGIILLVPGSVGFRSLFFAVEGDVARGIDTAVTLLVLLISLVAGLLAANMLVSARRTLS
jgi:uncharacterized membrane protein YjjP (DUF1212 family)